MTARDIAIHPPGIPITFLSLADPDLLAEGVEEPDEDEPEPEPEPEPDDDEPDGAADEPEGVEPSELVVLVDVLVIPLRYVLKSGQV